MLLLFFLVAVRGVHPRGESFFFSFFLFSSLLVVARGVCSRGERYSYFVFVCFSKRSARITNLREPAGLAVILKGYHPWLKTVINFKSERAWCECVDIFISVHKMSMRFCVACTFYVFLS